MGSRRTWRLNSFTFGSRMSSFGRSPPGRGTWRRSRTGCWPLRRRGPNGCVLGWRHDSEQQEAVRGPKMTDTYVGAARVRPRGGPAMKIGYADPPYPGQSAKHYGDHPDYAGEVDHAVLVAQLERHYDGW